MTNATESILRVALDHYGSAVVDVDAGGITLSDGTKIFFQSLLLELDSSDPQVWRTITKDWLMALDVVRTTIAASD